VKLRVKTGLGFLTLPSTSEGGDFHEKKRGEKRGKKRGAKATFRLAPHVGVPRGGKPEPEI